MAIPTPLLTSRPLRASDSAALAMRPLFMAVVSEATMPRNRPTTRCATTVAAASTFSLVASL